MTVAVGSCLGMARLVFGNFSIKYNIVLLCI